MARLSETDRNDAMLSDREASTGSSPNRGRKSLAISAGFGLALTLLASALEQDVIDLDLFHEIALIREIVETGEFPYRDRFAFTPTLNPVVHHEWGTGLVLYGVCLTSGWGSAGLTVLKLALLTGIVAATIENARIRRIQPSLYCFCAVPALLLFATGISTVRAQVFTLAFLAIVMVTLARDDHHRKVRFLAIAPLFLIWVNMHAGWVVGAGLIVLYVFETAIREFLDRRSSKLTWRRVRPFVFCLFSIAAITFATPFGRYYPAYVWDAIRMPRPNILEWAPLWRPNTLGYLAIHIGACATALYALVVAGPNRCRGCLMVVVTAILAIKHQRHLSIFAIVWFCLVPGWLVATPLSDEIEKLWGKRGRFLTLFWIALGSICIIFTMSKHSIRPRIPTSPAEVEKLVPVYPAGAVDFLRASKFRGNLMVPFAVGGFVSWNLFPDVLVSIDSRYEVAYPPGSLEASDRFYRAKPGWEDVLKSQPAQAILLPTWSILKPDMLAGALDYRGKRGWRIIYRDDAYCVLVPNDQATGVKMTDRKGQTIPGHFP